MNVEQLNATRLQQVHPIVASLMHQVIDKCAQQGVHILVTQGLRTWAEQDALYNQGRSAPGKKVTNAKGGQSYHNFGFAVDFVPIDALGKADWNVAHPSWQVVIDTAKQLHFESGAEWVTFKDYPHLQITGGLSLADLRKLYKTGGLEGCWNELSSRMA